MDYEKYVNKLSTEHETMLQTIKSVTVRHHARRMLKKILNDTVSIKRVLTTEKADWNLYAEQSLNDKIAFNQMLVKAIEDYLSPISVLD